MSLLGGVIAPHPPILIPSIGGPHLDAVAATTAALNQATESLDALGVEALVVISPHSPLFKDRFIVRGEDRLLADFQDFGASEPKFSIENDLAGAEAVVVECRTAGIPLQIWDSPGGPWLDWGVAVPYHFLGRGRQVLSLSIALLPLKAHWALGEAVKRALAPIKKRYAFVASGDLSHRLTADAPNGYSPRGSEFDGLIEKIIKSGRFEGLLDIDADLIDSAGECGLRSLAALGGALSKAKVEAKVLSYEGPFGVGYMVSTIF